MSYFMRNRKQAYALVGVLIGGSVIYYVVNLDEVPISGRTRMMDVSHEAEMELGKTSWEAVKKQYAGKILPDSHPLVRKVRTVSGPIVKASGLGNLKWEFLVVESPELNAFVLPGGKVCVFSGLFQITKDDDMLATVLAHEIGHVVARHSAENWSLARIAMLGAYAVTLVTGLDSSAIPEMFLQYSVQLPKSRALESEADHIGLLLMSKACYDPTRAVGVWERFKEEEAKHGTSSPLMQYVSTHPSSARRIDDIKAWLPEANKMQENSDCSNIRSIFNISNKGKVEEKQEVKEAKETKKRSFF